MRLGTSNGSLQAPPHFGKVFEQTVGIFWSGLVNHDQQNIKLGTFIEKQHFRFAGQKIGSFLSKNNRSDLLVMVREP